MTCGFCKEPCNNSWCSVKKSDLKKYVKEFIDNRNMVYDTIGEQGGKILFDNLPVDLDDQIFSAAKQGLSCIKVETKIENVIEYFKDNNQKVNFNGIQINSIRLNLLKRVQNKYPELLIELPNSENHILIDWS